MLFRSRVTTIVVALMVFLVLRSLVTISFVESDRPPTEPTLLATTVFTDYEARLAGVVEERRSNYEGSLSSVELTEGEEAQGEAVAEAAPVPSLHHYTPLVEEVTDEGQELPQIIVVSADAEELVAEDDEPRDDTGNNDDGKVLLEDVSQNEGEGANGDNYDEYQAEPGSEQEEQQQQEELEQEQEEEEEDEGPADDDYVYHKEAIPEPKLPSIRFTKDPKLTRLFFFAVVASFEEPVLISQFLDHYLALGVHPDHMHIDFHVGSQPKQDHSELLGLFAQRGITHVTPWEGVWSDPEKLARGEKALERMGVGPGDWILHVDSDEFQEYPMALGDFLAECDELGVNATAGHFLDRLTEDGTLPPLTQSTTLADFPLGCRFTKYGMNANHNKLGPYKYGMKVLSGGYHTLNSTDKTNEGKRIFRALRIHHVKWFDSVVQELKNRKNNVPKEAVALAEHIEKHNGKICVSCPEIKCQKVTKLPKIPTPKEARDQKMNDILFRYVLWVPPPSAAPKKAPRKKN